MPALAIGTRRILVGMDDHQFFMARRMRRGGMNVQVTELPAEGEVLLRRQPLVAEEDHAALTKDTADLG